VMGAHGEAATMATGYLRIAAAGLPFAFVAMAAQGYLRGVGDLRTPLLIIVAANVVNVGLELCFVYLFGWGVEGSAAATAAAQAGMGLGLVYRVRGVLHAGFHPRAAFGLLRLGRRIFVRSFTLHAAILVAAAVATRFGQASIAAHQITLQVWTLLALALDSLAIAGQVVVARELGAGAPAAAVSTARRLICLGVTSAALMALALGALDNVLPRLFSGNDAVVTHVHAIWPIFLAALVLSGAVYPLDGILLGAGDGRFLMWSTSTAAAVGATLAGAAALFDEGLPGVWLALATMTTVRLLTLSLRFRSREWAIVVAPGRPHDRPAYTAGPCQLAADRPHLARARAAAGRADR
jgi:putative MATE family efflux protein